jgi:hypothetical protein
MQRMVLHEKIEKQIADLDHQTHLISNIFICSKYSQPTNQKNQLAHPLKQIGRPKCHTVAKNQLPRPVE